MAKGRLTELDKKKRRRLLTVALIRLTATWVVLFGLYFTLPLKHNMEGGEVIRLVTAMVIFVCFVTYQIRRINRSSMPMVRAAEAFGAMIPLFITVFAAIYMSIQISTPHSFNQQLTQPNALYFTITVLSTVGFGDIVPVAGSARLVASVQMLVDLVLIGAVARLLFSVANRGFVTSEDLESDVVPTPQVEAQ